jgi:uncharacterized protein (TIGR02118 family)
MIQLSIHYPNHAGRHFDADYYFNRHMPMTIKLLSPALRGVSVVQGVSGALPGEPPPYAASCYLLFDSAEAFYAAFLPHAQVLRSDIQAYTDIEPIIQIGEVRISA